MYFELTTSPVSVLGHSTLIANGIWLHRSQDCSRYGYALGEHGGNFLHFDFLKQLNIQFSFYKDFELTQDLSQGILLSNIYNNQKKLPNNIIGATLTDQNLTFVYYDVKRFLKPSGGVDINQAVSEIESVLLENLTHLQQLTKKLYVAYSGGLDSGTIAWLCHKHRIDFTAVVDYRFANFWPNLPFDIEISNLTNTPGDTQFVWNSTVADHFYHPQFNRCIGGFYGDLALLHHGHVYNQSKDLVEEITDSEYDKTVVGSLQKFSSVTALLASVVKLHSGCEFRQWFDDFEIYDPYRDPRLLTAVLNLNLNDLVWQFKTAGIQKQILNNLEVDCWNFLCDYKNDYSKFQVC